MRRTSIPHAIVGLAVLGSLSACSVSIGTSRAIASHSLSLGTSGVSGDEVEAAARASFGDRMPASAEIDCPEPLEAAVGSTTRCTWTFEDESTLGMTATVKKVGPKVSISFQNDQKATSGP